MYSTERTYKLVLQPVFSDTEQWVRNRRHRVVVWPANRDREEGRQVDSRLALSRSALEGCVCESGLFILLANGPFSNNDSLMPLFCSCSPRVRPSVYPSMSDGTYSASGTINTFTYFFLLHK